MVLKNIFTVKIQFFISKSKIYQQLKQNECNCVDFRGKHNFNIVKG